MTENTVADRDAVRKLLSDGQNELLNAIDGLRRQNVDADIAIPQIVVCGNQYSGKSSVLEALAQVRFPLGEGTTTRFPIKVVLRKADEVSIGVKLCPSSSHFTHAEEVRNFETNFEIQQQGDFPKLVEAASNHLREIDDGCKFWTDLLRAEISGPQQPHLTLVDLPGLIQVEQPPEVNPGDKGKIKALVETYLKSPSTIVVAIIDATNDRANQEILGLVHDLGVTERTIGVITKPDLLPRDSDKERSVVRLAKNEDICLGLGWHVVRNLAHEAPDRSMDQRDRAEEQFFSQTSAWSALDESNVGIAALRRRLSRNLLGSISEGLGDLVTIMTQQMDNYITAMERLGPERSSAERKRTYLNHVVAKFARLVEAGQEGDYSKEEFRGFFQDT